MIRIIVSMLFLVLPLTLAAQSPRMIIEEPGVIDRSYLERQVEKIDQLARTRMGTQVRKNMSDLDLIQSIINRELIPSTDTESLQALGAVMGNVLAADFPALEWKIYIDQLGRSRALCVTGTQHCLFPITMLSRRMETGLKPDARKVYDGAVELIEEYLPHTPYGGGVLRNFQRATP